MIEIDWTEHIEDWNHHTAQEMKKILPPLHHLWGLNTVIVNDTSSLQLFFQRQIAADGIYTRPTEICQPKK